jgi:raffinose/stachyose/melibiose transport system permease protein
MCLIGLCFVSPVYVLLNLSFSPASGIASPLELTTHPTLSNYVDAWQEGSLGGALLTTMFVTFCSVLLIVAVSAFASFPLARATERWSRWTFYLVMAGLVIPFVIAMIPLYQTMHQVHLLGSPLSLIILYAGSQFPLSVFLYTTFLRQLPREYEDAAAIDGCGSARAFLSVVLPMMKPVTGTVVIVNAILIWNDFLVPLLFLGNGRYQTLPVAIYGFVGSYTSQWPLIFAGVTISILPMLLVFFGLQRRMMRGLVSGLTG